MLIYAGEVLPTITSPVFSEIVAVFFTSEVGRPSESLACVVHELYKIKEFNVAFCLEALETSVRMENQRKLTLETNEAMAAGLYDFLPCPPSVFSRPVLNYDLHHEMFRVVDSINPVEYVYSHCILFRCADTIGKAFLRSCKLVEKSLY